MIINIPPHGKCIECTHWKSGKERNRPFAGCEIYGHEDPGYSTEIIKYMRRWERTLSERR